MNTDIFRLAAVLYADNNYELTPKTIHRKIVESVFLKNNNEFIGIHTLIDQIKNNYGFDFTFEEIMDVIADDNFFSKSPCKNEEVKLTLASKRYSNISSKISNNNLDYFIQEFQKINHEYKLDEIRNVIYNFLYCIFQNNLTGFSKLLDPKIHVNELLNITDFESNPIEKEIINSFLNWENDDKNKIIFDIYNVAIEYCIITNKKGNNLKLENLGGKNFYLDTNVIFRAIGLNGEHRRNRTLTFLDKFIEAKENLFISKFTNDEIRNTINYYTSQIKRYSTAKIQAEAFNKFSKTDDFLDFYHKWRYKRSNDSLELFTSHIFSLIDDLKSKYLIKNDFKDHYDVSDSKIDEQIKDKASQINSFKTSNKGYSSKVESSIWDAKNILLIEFFRHGQSVNIFDGKHFFISTDQNLQKWDYTQNSSLPIVLLPSQWMSILLRYLNRTSDDFKSFVSFLNLNKTDDNISSEKLHLILTGISEITSDLTHQTNIIAEMINNKFQGILEKSITDEDIIERSKNYAKNQLEIELENLQKANHKLATKFEKYQENTTSAIDNLQKSKNFEKEEKDRERFQKDKEIEKSNKIREDLIKVKSKLDLNNYKSKAFFCVPIAIFCILYFFLLFSYQNHPWNIVAVYTKYANNLPEGSMQKEFCKWLWLLPGSILVGCCIFIYHRLFDSEQKNKKIQEFTDYWTKELMK